MPSDQFTGDAPIQMADVEPGPMFTTNNAHHKPSPECDAQSALSSDDGRDHDGSDDGAGYSSANNRLEIFKYLTRYSSLDRTLESPHITGMYWVLEFLRLTS
jgi:hypothetical protein